MSYYIILMIYHNDYTNVYNVAYILRAAEKSKC